MKDLHLVLTHHWFNEIYEGRKLIEYRTLNSYWRKRILDKFFDRVIFHKGYTNEVVVAEISEVDIGECPYDGYDGKHIRIHFCDVKGGKQ